MGLDKDDFLDQFKNIKTEVDETEKAVQLVKNDIKKIQDSIQNSENRVMESSINTDVLQLKIALLKRRSLKYGDKSSMYEELTQRIRQRVEKWKRDSRIGKDKMYYSSSKGQDLANTIETACHRKIRVACEQIIAMKKQQLAESVSNRNKESGPAEQRTRDQLWTQIEDILTDFPPKEVLYSIGYNTKQSSNALTTKKNRINLAKDAEDLRFKFESGKLQDISDQPALLQSVDQLIEDGQDNHFTRFLETEKAKNDTWKEKKRFEKTRQHMNSLLEKKYEGREKELNLRRRVHDLEIELYGIKASTVYIKELINDLKSQRKEKQQAEESLREKYSKIQEFESEAQCKQLMIQSLVKQNGSAKNRLDQQRKELIDYLRKQICSLGSEIDAAMNALEQNLARETELFSSMNITQLKSAELDSGQQVPFEDMSIHRLTIDAKTPAMSALQTVKEGLQFPTYLASEKLLERIREVKEREFSSIRREDGEFNSGDALNSDAIAERLTNLQDMSSDIVEMNERGKQEMLPVLHGSLSNATDSLKDCLHLEKMIHAWWNQPAQFTVPWVKEGGMNLRQWHTQWEINSARLAQSQISK